MVANPTDEEPPSAGGLDTFTAPVETVHALTRHFPDHNGPFERVSRLAEEAGELAQHVNHAEGMGVKVAEHGPAEPSRMIKELMDVPRAAVGLAVHYDLVDDLRDLIAVSHRQHATVVHLTSRRQAEESVARLSIWTADARSLDQPRRFVVSMEEP